MNFERGKDPKEAINIGMTTKSLDVGEMALILKEDWTSGGARRQELRELKPKKVKKILRKASRGKKIRKRYHITHVFVNGVAPGGKELTEYKGKILKYEGNYYNIPK